MLSRLRSSLLENLFEFDRYVTPGEALFFRVFEVAVTGWVIAWAWDWAFLLQRMGDVVLPLGLAVYVDVSFMFGNALPFINAGLITALIAVGFFRKWNAAYFVAFLFLHMQYAARYSQGEIPHSSNVVSLTFLGIGLAMMVFTDPKYRHRFTFGFTYFFLGLGYMLAALSKLVGTGLFWADGRHLWMWIYEKEVDALSKTGVLEFNWIQQLALDYYWVATAFLLVGFITELSAFLMWWKRFRTVTLLAVINLHIGIYLVMNIMFTANMYLLVLLVLPWAAWMDQVLAWSKGNPMLNRLQGTPYNPA